MNEPRIRALFPLVLCAAVLLTAAAPPSLATLLSSPDTQTAARGALLLGRTKNSQNAGFLERHTNDRRVAVRALSVYGLGLIGLRRDGAVLLDAATDPSSAVRLAAVDAIGRFESENLLDPAAETMAASRLERILLQDRDSDVRGRAALSLADFGDSPEAAPAALALRAATAYGQPAGVRRRAMWTIFRRYATRVPWQYLRARLRDRDEVVRIEAVRAFGKLGNAARAADLRPLLGDPSWRVQEQAAESIRILRGLGPTQHLGEIPPYVHVPAPVPDPLAALPALPRPAAHGGRPRAGDVPAVPAVDPRTAAQMLAPAHGPHPRLRFVTSEGNFYVVLYPEWAPYTVANFLNLVNRGFLDDNRWFRIVPDFVVQTGEKDDVKQPGPGYEIDAELNPLEQNSYIISMGLDYDMKTMTPKINSAGSEYYITLSPQYHLDDNFTVFGAVSSGFDVFGRLTEHDRVIRIERIKDVVL